MAYSANTPRRVVIRANRDTLALLGGACALTFVIAYGVHRRSAVSPPEMESAAEHQGWTGHLAEIEPMATADAKPEPLSSESLTVPKAQLALPVSPVKPKGRPCESSVPCLSRSSTPVVLPVRRQVPATRASHTASQQNDNGLLHALNPLNHMPDMSVVKRPFTYAGDVVAGWIKRF